MDEAARKGENGEEVSMMWKPWYWVVIAGCVVMFAVWFFMTADSTGEWKEMTNSFVHCFGVVVATMILVRKKKR